MKRILLSGIALLLLVCPMTARGDAGVLIPRDKQQPDAKILSLDEMEVTIRIDNGVAKVYIRQVFGNHTGRIEEGNYVFALSQHATISDFAVWDGPTRIPAVILERKRAEEIYAQLKAQSIDPGLLQMGERDADEARRSAVFSAKIVPIPAYASKRMEIEYHETIPVENLKSYFALPLRPDAYQAQVAGHLWINFELHSAHALQNFQQGDKSFPLKISQKDAHTVKGTFEATNIKFDEDFAVTYDLDPKASDSLEVLAFRDPNSPEPDPTETSPTRSTNEPGFVEAQLLVGSGAAQQGGAGRNVVALFDNSLSMQWEKLEREYEALEKLLRTLRPTDHFNLILFNTQVSTFRPAPDVADPAEVQKALDFIRNSRIRGGTDLQRALDAALAQCSQPNSYLVLLSDGGANRGTIQNGKLAAWYAGRWKQLPETSRPHTYVYAVGDDANLPLMRMLARNDGVMEQVLSTEPTEFKLNAFLSKIGRSPVAQLKMDVSPSAAVEKIYPLQDSAFPGSIASWIGQYKSPAKGASFVASGVRDGRALEAKKTAELPSESHDHPQLPRIWARARVDALLDKIEKEGEDRATIDEIIALARRYKLVTPYTSFLAVPRALLRPRVIRPGDPILRVHTDEAIVSVVAIFPFGLTKPLRFLADEKVWQTRFLAPTDMRDGTYDVRLILRDRNGNTYRESKSFIIASTPPTLKINTDKTRYRSGETVQLKVSATQSTRTLVARLAGAIPINLRWDERTGYNTGALIVPENLPAGRYRLTVTAEDVAHNIGAQEVELEVIP